MVSWVLLVFGCARMPTPSATQAFDRAAAAADLPVRWVADTNADGVVDGDEIALVGVWSAAEWSRWTRPASPLLAAAVAEVARRGEVSGPRRLVVVHDLQGAPRADRAIGRALADAAEAVVDVTCPPFDGDPSGGRGAVAKALSRAAGAATRAEEAGLRRYLTAAARSVVNGDWAPADAAFAALPTTGRWVVGIGPAMGECMPGRVFGLEAGFRVDADGGGAPAMHRVLAAGAVGVAPLLVDLPHPDVAPALAAHHASRSAVLCHDGWLDVAAAPLARARSERAAGRAIARVLAAQGDDAVGRAVQQQVVLDAVAGGDDDDVLGVLAAAGALAWTRACVDIDPSALDAAVARLADGAGGSSAWDAADVVRAEMPPAPVVELAVRL